MVSFIYEFFKNMNHHEIHTCLYCFSVISYSNTHPSLVHIFLHRLSLLYFSLSLTEGYHFTSFKGFTYWIKEYIELGIFLHQDNRVVARTTSLGVGSDPKTKKYSAHIWNHLPQGSIEKHIQILYEVVSYFILSINVIY